MDGFSRTSSTSSVTSDVRLFKVVGNLHLLADYFESSNLCLEKKKLSGIYCLVKIGVIKSFATVD